MGGTRAGGLKAKETNLKKHGADFYKKIGSKGGKNGHTGGFFNNPALARIAGAKGGRNGRRDVGIVYKAVSAESTYSGSAKHLAEVLDVSVSSIYIALKGNRKVLGEYEITRQELGSVHGKVSF